MDDLLLATSVSVREFSGRPYTLVGLSGDADTAAIGVLRKVFGDVIASQPGTLIIDLGELRFMDSAALHAILAASRLLADGGGVTGLINPNEAVRAVLRLSQADQLIGVYGSLADAMTASGSRNA